MRKLIRVMAVNSLLVVAACGGGSGDETAGRDVTPAEQPYVALARHGARALGGELQQRLQEAMREGGPLAAVSVCAEEAPAIATRVSKELDLEIGRTALRVRNTANAPDDWERAQMEAFRSAMEAGEDPMSLEVSEVFEMEGQTVLRWMKPIPMGQVCVICHGQNVDPSIIQAIKTEYPDDTATGFALGEMRGAFTATVALDPR